MLAAAVAAYGTGSVTYTAVGRPDDLDVPWTAHAAWLSFHLLCCAAVVLLVRRRMRALAASLALDGVTGALMLAALTAALFLGDVTTGAVSGFDQFSGVAYLSGDLLLVAVLVWTASLGGRGGARMWMAMRDAMRPDDPLDPEAVVADRAPARCSSPSRSSCAPTDGASRRS